MSKIGKAIGSIGNTVKTILITVLIFGFAGLLMIIGWFMWLIN